MFRNRTYKKNLFIEKGSNISFGRGEFKIRCIKGSVWITWPWSEDVILHSGNEISFRTEGILCIKAFTGSIIEIERRRIFPCLKSVPRLIIFFIIRSLISVIKNGGGNSVFGDSVHSITR